MIRYLFAIGGATPGEAIIKLHCCAISDITAVRRHRLSHEDVSGENGKAAHSNCGVDANQYPRKSSLEEMRDK